MTYILDRVDEEELDILNMFDNEAEAALEAKLDYFESYPGVACSRDLDDLAVGHVPF